MSELNHLGALTSRDSDRAALARDLRRRITDPTCADPGAGWLQLETDYERAMSKTQRREVLQRAWAICHTCAHVEPCGLLAVIDQHTGLSAGDAYRNGRRLDERGRSLPPER